MANVILVAGTWHGGWVWQEIPNRLRELGHNVFAPTLSGLEDEPNRLTPINLDTHIDDVLKIIESNQLDEVLLLGSSYGGMVITGVADRTTAKVAGVLYLDAQVPEPGQREWDLIPPNDRGFFLDLCVDGINIEVPEPWASDSRTRPHALATKLQKLDYSKSKHDGLQKVFVFAEKWLHIEGLVSPFASIRDRISAEPGWRILSAHCGHDVGGESPDLVVNLVQEMTAVNIGSKS